MSQLADQTVLIVDDMPTNVEVLAGALMKAGYQVAVALNGESALEQIQYKSPALVLLDVMMPGIDGFETCRQLKASPATEKIPVIFMTALSETVSKSKGFQLGAVDYITKPFEAEEVLARVKTHLRLYQLTTCLEQEVVSRTAELEVAIAHLKQTQTQLVQSERMSLVGDIAAGVAHEMSNPVNYIRGNLRHVEGYFTQLLQFTEAVYPQVRSLIQKDEALFSHLDESVLDLDLDFISQDWPKLLGSFTHGSDKINQLVFYLRILADSDKSGKRKIDLQALVEGAVVLLGHKLQAKTHQQSINIREQYRQLPQIECYPAAFSQALIGILLFYIAQIEFVRGDEKNSFPEISIELCAVSDSWVSLCVSSDFSQISDSAESLRHQSEVENAFRVGDNISLQLAHDVIVQQHGGRLCQSNDIGIAKVTIELPIASTVSVSTPIMSR